MKKVGNQNREYIKLSLQRIRNGAKWRKKQYCIEVGNQAFRMVLICQGEFYTLTANHL